MKMLVACHDAGGAEMIGAWLAKRKDEWAATLAGPAEAVFRRRFGEVRDAASLDGIDFVICGSGEGNWETSVWQRAKSRNCPTVVFLEHWKNYASRFRDG